MRTHGKKYTRGAPAGREQAPIGLEEALPLVQKLKFAKFDETVALSIRLGVDPKHADQMVRGTVVLPHGLGKSKNVLVIAGPDKQKEARRPAPITSAARSWSRRSTAAGQDFDAVVATPDMMRVVGKLGKVLGPRGLMPNPKTGTVTAERGARPSRKSRPARSSSASTRPASCTRRSARSRSRPQNLVDNAAALIDSIVKAKPAAAKGKYLKSITVSSTMGPGVKHRRERRRSGVEA